MYYCKSKLPRPPLLQPGTSRLLPSFLWNSKWCCAIARWDRSSRQRQRGGIQGAGKEILKHLDLLYFDPADPRQHKTIGSKSAVPLFSLVDDVIQVSLVLSSGFSKDFEDLTHPSRPNLKDKSQGHPALLPFMKLHACP